MAQKTFAEMFYLEEGGLVRRLGRDIRLLRQLFGMTMMYFTLGRRLRAEYRRRQAAGETFWIDKYDPARRPRT